MPRKVAPSLSFRDWVIRQQADYARLAVTELVKLGWTDDDARALVAEQQAVYLADKESLGERLAKAHDRVIAILNDPPSIKRREFIAALAAEVRMPAEELTACADRILADLYVRGYVVRLDVMEDKP